MTKKLVIIDNYDSFTYNLVHLVQEIMATTVTVWRNDQFDLKDIDQFDTIILSPGPGIPSEAGLLKDVIRQYYRDKKILGVCLGHQALGEVFGARLKNLDEVYHGVQTQFQLLGNSPLFEGLDTLFLAGRYHSWVIEKNSLPGDLINICTDDHGEIMGIQHITLPIFGVQFHPESILTPSGRIILDNFLKI